MASIATEDISMLTTSTYPSSTMPSLNAANTNTVIGSCTKMPIYKVVENTPNMTCILPSRKKKYGTLRPEIFVAQKCSLRCLNTAAAVSVSKWLQQLSNKIKTGSHCKGGCFYIPASILYPAYFVHLKINMNTNGLQTQDFIIITAIEQVVFQL